MLPTILSDISSLRSENIGVLRNTYTFDGAATKGDWVGLTAAGEATKITVDYALPAVDMTADLADNTAMTQVASCMLDASTVVAVYRRDAGDVYVANGTVSGVDGSTSWNTVQDTTSNSAASREVAICKVGTNKIFIAWNKSSTSVACMIGTLSAGVFTFGSEYDAYTDSIDCSRIQVCSPDTDKAVVFFGEASDTLRARCCTISALVPTFGTTVDVTSQTSVGGIRCIKIATDKVAYSYIANNGSDNVPHHRVTSVSGNTLTLGTECESKPKIQGTGANLCVDMASLTDNEFHTIISDEEYACYAHKTTVSGTTCTIDKNNRIAVFGTTLIRAWKLDSTWVLAAFADTTLSTPVVHLYYIKDDVSSVIQSARWSSVDIDDSAYGRHYDIAFYSGEATYLFVFEDQTNDYLYDISFQSTKIGQTTWEASVPIEIVRVLGIVLANVTDGNDAAVGMRGDFADYRTGMTVTEVYVRGPNNIQSVQTLEKGSLKQAVLGIPWSSSHLQVFPDVEESPFPENIVIRDPNFITITGHGSADTWSSWETLAYPYGQDTAVANVSVKQPVEALTSWIQLAYGTSVTEYVVFVEIPAAILQSTAVGHTSFVSIALPDLPELPAGNYLAGRIKNSAGSKNLDVHVRLVLPS